MNLNLDNESASETEEGKQKATQSKQSEEKKEENKHLKPETDKTKQDGTNMSMQSGGLTSSLAETSEDEEAKKKAEKEAKKAKKGLDEEDLAKEVDIELQETDTCWLLHIPSKKVPAEPAEEYQNVKQANDVYENLLKSKIGSDNYNQRGTQTANLTMKTREIAQRGFT